MKKTFIFYETGQTCRAEFLMKNGAYISTEDAVVIGITEGADAHDALDKLMEESPWLRDYVLRNIVAREAGAPIYL